MSGLSGTKHSAKGQSHKRVHRAPYPPLPLPPFYTSLIHHPFPPLIVPLLPYNGWTARIRLHSLPTQWSPLVIRTASMIGGNKFHKRKFPPFSTLVQRLTRRMDSRACRVGSHRQEAVRVFLVSTPFTTKVMIFFANSGAEANEGGPKMGRKVGNNRWGRQKPRVLENLFKIVTTFRD